MTSISVVICDDQPLIVSSLALILETDPQIKVVATAANGADGVQQVIDHAPTVALMDIQMPQLDGIAATAQITAQSSTKVVVLTTFDRDDYLIDALDAGASGFILKNTEPEFLINAIKQVAAGHALLSPEMTMKLIRHRTGNHEPDSTASGERSKLDTLTERELQVLTELARGKNNQEIALVLSLSEATVKTHLSNILAKLHLRDRVQAVLFAYRVGLIQ